MNGNTIIVPVQDLLLSPIRPAGDIDDLAASLKRDGQQTPISCVRVTVRADESTHLCVINGHRRVYALQKAGLSTAAVAVVREAKVATEEERDILHRSLSESSGGADAHSVALSALDIQRRAWDAARARDDKKNWGRRALAKRMSLSDYAANVGATAFDATAAYEAQYKLPSDDVREAFFSRLSSKLARDPKALTAAMLSWLCRPLEGWPATIEGPYVEPVKPETADAADAAKPSTPEQTTLPGVKPPSPAKADKPDPMGPSWFGEAPRGFVVPSRARVQDLACGRIIEAALNEFWSEKLSTRLASVSNEELTDLISRLQIPDGITVVAFDRLFIEGIADQARAIVERRLQTDLFANQEAPIE